MNRIDRHRKEFDCGEGSLVVSYDNRGEPFREGYEIQICKNRDWGDETLVGAFLDRSELEDLRDYLNKVLS